MNRQLLDKNGINFISSTGYNNGIATKVKRNKNNTLYKSGSITVSLKGSVLSAFLQKDDFYCAHQIAALTPKYDVELNLYEKMYYCICIKKNKYKYNFGRQADKTLAELKIPNKESIPSFVYENKIEAIEKTTKDGKERNRSIEHKIFKGSKYITITNNGSVGYAFYQPKDFTCTHDVNPITTKQLALNQYVALFITTLIGLEKYRWAYGRKWRPMRMPSSLIQLPIDNNGKPDWQFMEDYIKSLPYSSNL